MESNRKRRGISLSHNSYKPTPQPVHQNDSSLTTRVQYLRYPITKTITRQYSVPKTNINFNYRLQHGSLFQQYVPVYNTSIVTGPSYTPQNNLYLQRFRQSNNQVNNLQAVGSRTVREMIIVPVHHESFKQKTQFATNLTSGSSFNCQLIQRANSVKIPQIEPFSTSINQHFEKKSSEPKLLPNLATQPFQHILQDSLKINILPKEDHRHKVEKQEKQQEVKNQILTERKPQENMVQPKKDLKQKKDPIKLKQMQRRLLQIIKICDQNA